MLRTYSGDGMNQPRMYRFFFLVIRSVGYISSSYVLFCYGHRLFRTCMLRGQEWLNYKHKGSWIELQSYELTTDLLRFQIPCPLSRYSSTVDWVFSSRNEKLFWRQIGDRNAGQ